MVRTFVLGIGVATSAEVPTRGMVQDAERAFTQLLGSAAFLALPLGALMELLSGDGLEVGSEMEVWMAVAAWVQHAEASRRRHLLRLIGAPWGRLVDAA